MLLAGATCAARRCTVSLRPKHFVFCVIIIKPNKTLSTLFLVIKDVQFVCFATGEINLLQIFESYFRDLLTDHCRYLFIRKKILIPSYNITFGIYLVFEVIFGIEDYV